MKKLLLSSAAFLALAVSQGGAADLGVPPAEFIPEVPVAAPFSWSGVYFGVHGGGVISEGSGSGGCGAFRDLVREDGGPPLFSSAEEIADIDGDGWDDDGHTDETGCFDADIVSGPNSGPDDGGDFEAFNLDDDYIGIIDGDDGDDDDIEFMGGVQVGINQQYGRLVLGLEGDISGVFGDDNGENIEFDYFDSISDTDGSPTPDLDDYEGTGTVSAGEIEWISTFRGRVGGAFGTEGRLLAYLTGGVALAGVEGLSGEFDDDEADSTCEANETGDDTIECGFGGSDDRIDVGIALGAGGEYAFTNSISFGLEYMFLGFDTFDIDNGGGGLTFFGGEGRAFSFEDNTEDMHVIRAKLNVRWPPAG